MAQIPAVNPSELIESAWGNAIRDQTVQVFASSAERAAAIPTPKAGQVTYLTASGAFDYWDATSWRTLGGGQLAYKVKAADQQGIQGVPVDVIDLAATVTVPAGRRLHLHAEIGFYKQAGDITGWNLIAITGTDNIYIRANNTVSPAGTYGSAVVTARVNPPAGSSLYKVRMLTSSGYVNVSAGSAFSIDDIGPSTMPT